MKFKQVISYRLFMTVMLFTIIITLSISSFQLYLHYRNQLTDVKQNFIKIQERYVATIADRLWVVDRNQLQILLDSIIQLPNIVYTKIEVDGRIIASAGDIESERVTHYEVTPDGYERFETGFSLLASDCVIHQEFQLFYQQRMESLGTLHVFCNLQGIYAGLFERAFEILIAEGSQILIVSLFILFVFQWQVTRHLETMSRYFQTLDPQKLDNPLTLQRRWTQGTEPDELDQVVAAINTMRENLKKSFADLNVEFERRQEAEKSKLRLATAVERASESFILLNQDHIIEYINPAFERLSGYSPEDVIGKKPDAFHSCLSDKEFFSRIWNEVNINHTWTGRTASNKKDGDKYEAEITISSVKDDSGTITNYVIIIRDVTLEVKMEKQLRQAQKMEAMGALAGGIAHDFNNMLSPIMGYAEIALLKMKPDNPLRNNFEQILTAARRAKDLVSQILTFSRQKEQERKPVQISLIINEVVKLLKASLPSTIEIRIQISPTTKSKKVFADPTQMHQVMMNLCTNAAYAMRERGGVLDVSLSSVELDADFVAPYPDVEPGPYLRLNVSDTGCGMDEAVKRRIFDPFFTTKELGEGTGMGLAVVYGIVKSCRGLITVYSEPGRGSVFHVYLPEIQSEDNHTIEMSEPLPVGKERILLVDDDKTLVEMEKDMLRELGYEVTARFSGPGALETFMEHPDRFDLVITDQTMPTMTGAELAKNLLKIRPKIPIILCTGFSEIMTEEKSKKLGIRGYIMKPVLMSEIAKTVRQILDETKE